MGESVNRNFPLLGVVAASLMLPACATVTRGTSQKYSIVSQPNGAEVKLSTGQTCITPCELKLKRRPGFTATIKKQGYRVSEVIVESKLGGGGALAGAGNLLAGGLVGGIVDGSNGSMNNLTPNPLKVTLVPEPAAVAPLSVPAPAAATSPTTPPAPTTTSDARDGNAPAVTSAAVVTPAA